MYAGLYENMNLYSELSVRKALPITYLLEVILLKNVANIKRIPKKKGSVIWGLYKDVNLNRQFSIIGSNTNCEL